MVQVRVKVWVRVRAGIMVRVRVKLQAWVRFRVRVRRWPGPGSQGLGWCRGLGLGSMSGFRPGSGLFWGLSRGQGSGSGQDQGPWVPGLGLLFRPWLRLAVRGQCQGSGECQTRVQG